MTEQEEFEFRNRLEKERKGAPAGPDAADKYAGQDVNQMGTVMRALGGAKGAWDRAAMGLKGVFTDLTPEDKALLEQGRAFENKAGAPATIGSIGADVAMSAAPGGLVTKAVSKAPLLARTLAEIGYGAGYGALTNPEDRTAGAVGGGAGTAVGMGVNRLIGGAIRPLVSKDAQALMDQGIQPTLGQAMGGAVNQAEQKLKSLPFAGDLIRNARGRAVNEFNEKAIQVSNPASKGFGDEALTATREALGDKFDDVLRSIPQLNLNTGSVKQFAATAVTDPALNLANKSQQKVLAYVQKNLLDRSGSMNGETAQRIGSDALKAAQRWKYSTNSEEQAMGEALERITNEWRDSLVKAAGAKGPQLREAQEAWRAFIPVDRAGSYRGNQNIASNEVPGRFTPNSLRRSIEASDQSQFNNATRAMSGGTSPFQRLNTLTRQGERVLGDSVPDSGTAGRLGMMEIFKYGGAAGAGGAAAYADPGTALGTAALLAAPYSRTGSKFLMQGLQPAYEAAVKQLTLRGVPTQAIDEALRKYGPQGVISLARGVGVNSQQ